MATDMNWPAGAGDAVAAAEHESAAARRLSDRDQRLVAALMLLEQDLSDIILDILALQFDPAERQALGVVLATIAADLQGADPEPPAVRRINPVLDAPPCGPSFTPQLRPI